MPDRLSPTGHAMAERTRLPRTGLEISRIGLGLAHMHTLPAEDRAKLIHRALDLGITHFDTSRFYSDGLSESVLGDVLGKNRSSITIATKFGLLPTPLIASAGIAATPLRKVRSLLNKLHLVPYPRRSYTPETMRKSLHASLRALKTDCIDLYFIHEPIPGHGPNDDVFTELEREKQKGSIKYIGVSGAFIDPVVERFGKLLDVVQSAESTWSESKFVPDITHSLFSDAVRAQGGRLSDDAIRGLLHQALARRSNGAVIVQTRRPAHLEEMAVWAVGR